MNKLHFSFKTIAGFLVAAVLLSACIFPEENDPFERLPEEQSEVIYGDLYPFSVSVSTRATHRLERDNKLVGYLTSDLVRLEDFEGQTVELEGVWRNEKMREIFWVEAVKVAGGEEEEPDKVRFQTKNFTFLYPSNWDYTESPDAKLFFVDKSDTNRRVFLTFSVEPFSPEAEQIDPNFVLSGIAGTKVITTKDSGREQEVITLYSNDGTQQYVFKADYAFDDFDKKRAMLDLLESFVEGESQVATVIEGEKIKQAEAEAAKLAEQSERKALEAKARLVDEVVDENEQSFLDRLLSRGEPTEEPITEPVSEDEPVESAEPDEVAVVQEAIQEAVTLESAQDFENLIDGRAFSYNSQAFDYRVQVPFGFWFQNFGASEDSRFELGVANNEINGRDSVDFWLRGKSGMAPESAETSLEGEVLTIKKAWKEGAFIEVTGPVEFKDAMWSVLESVGSL